MSKICTQIDIDCLDYQGLSTNAKGGKQVNVRTVKGSQDYQDKLTFQMSEDEKTNLQKAIWGLNGKSFDADPNKRTLELTVESEALKDFLTRLDELNIKKAVSNSKEWFKKEIDEVSARNSYVTILKNKDDVTSVKVKVIRSSEKGSTKIYRVVSQDGEELEMEDGTFEDITRNSKCMVIVSTNGLWFMQRQFGMALQATHILVWTERVAQGANAFSFSSGAKINFKRERDDESVVDMEP